MSEEFTYKVVISEGISYRQYVGYVEAKSKNEAEIKARECFIKENPLYSAKFVVNSVDKFNDVACFRK